MTQTDDVPAVHPRPEVRGKFLWVGERKLYVKGVTYGTFKSDVDGVDFPPPWQVHEDFAAMAACGINTVRTYTVPPRQLLDIAQRHGLHVMVGLPWEQHVAFLDDRARCASIEARVREGIRACQGHPAVLAYTIGNEVPAGIVRWHGRKRAERWLERLYRAAKQEDPDALVTYVNFPTTEYLELPFVDFCCFNVYLESEETLSAYLARLQNLAGERPLVMAEIGLDSRRNGLEEQARSLGWQVRAAFRAGCAGAMVFSWTDEWHRGGHDVDDWDFGLTTRNRTPKPALAAVVSAFDEAPVTLEGEWPRISVVICSYNGERTIGAAINAAQQLRYPDWELIVVDDGSTDATAEIAREKGARVITTENRGLASARNTGAHASTGEIVAYCDDDACPDPDWLTYLAVSFQDGGHAAVGGPNLAPRDDGLVADCVANAPGGPVHVLLSDVIAEHVPGCNMAVTRQALLAVGGFDAQFRVAGDDVDVCWALQQKGWTLGFSPAAVVWHHRRASVTAYLRQQRGYGKAEALLERKWPEKYNSLGHLPWVGRLYGPGVTRSLLAPRRRVHHGVWGSAPFQSVYEPAAGMLAALPLMPEWYLLAVVLTCAATAGALWAPLLVALPVLVVLLLAMGAQAVAGAVRATPAPRATKRRVRAARFAVVTLLHLFQPAARMRGRLSLGLTPWRDHVRGRLAIPRARKLQIWSESWRSPTARLEAVEDALRRQGARVIRGGPSARWDVEARAGILGSTRALVAVEEHGAGRQMVRARLWPRLSVGALAVVALTALWALAAATSAHLIVAAALGAAALVVGGATLRQSAAATGALLNALDEQREGVDAATVTAPATPTTRRLRPLLRYLWPQWRTLLVVLATMLVGIGIALLAPWPVKLLVDYVVGNQPVPGALASVAHLLPGDDVHRQLLVLVAASGVVLFAAGVVMSMFNQLASVRLSVRMTYGLAEDLFAHILRLSPRFHSRHSTGDTLARVTGDPSCVQILVVDALIPALQSSVTVAAMLVIMLQLNATLTLLALGITPFLIISIKAFAAPMKRRERQRRDLEAQMMSVVEQSLGAIPVVQAFTRQERERRRFGGFADKTIDAYRQATVLQMWFQFFAGLCTALGTAVVIYVGATAVLDHKMTVGDILVFIAYLGSLYGPLNAMTHTSATLQYAAAQADRVMEVMEVEPEVQDAPDAIDLAISGHVRYEDVTFGYDEDRAVLHNVSLEARPGDVVAIVGPTGAGKTTLLNMLVRFFDPWSGRITIDGHDLRHIKVHPLRTQVAMVLQDPFIFPLTIADNIAYGRPEATREEIVAAAEAANADAFIRRLPGGYDSVVGERGTTLSGGEKQRLAIARAFLKDSPILVLDEPTSALDARTESMLLDALERLMEGRLTFIVAHRLSTIRHADQILVVRDGEIIERGDHAELVRAGGMYSDLYRTQMDFAHHDAGDTRPKRTFVRRSEVEERQPS